jgi:hypothetical protein
LENLKSNLRLAYKLAAKANRKSHLNNKLLYDRRTKPREFEVQDLVYLYNPALKSGLTRKFAKPWIGPCQITKEISELNYEIVDSKCKREVVHVNRLKKSFNPEFWNPKPRQKPERNALRKVAKPQRAKRNSQDDVRIGPYPLVCPQNSEARTEHEPLGDHSSDTPDLSQQPTDTPITDRNDHSYQPLNTPHSRREHRTPRTNPPLSTLRSNALYQDVENQLYVANGIQICMLSEEHIQSLNHSVIIVKERNVILSNDHWREGANVNLSTYHEMLSTVKSALVTVEKQRKEFT